MGTGKARIGILTSGGDCPGLNAVIRGAVKSAVRLEADIVGFRRGFEGLVDPVTYVPLDTTNTAGIISRGGTILGSTNQGRFVARSGVDDRLELDPQLLSDVQRTLDQLGIMGLICIGGDGSLSVAQQFHERGIPVVGVPKTIDNDLSATAFSFGFDSAVACATDAMDRLHTTAESHERIMVLEVMGRHTGWIALQAGIAGAASVILIPEIPWTWEHVCQKILERDNAGKRFSLIVVAEGAELPGGGLVTNAAGSGGGQVRLGGIGHVVAQQLHERLKRETRVVVLGHLQRGGPPTNFDRALATQFGAHAVRLVLQRQFGQMVAYDPPDVKSVPILDAVHQISRVSPNSSAVVAARTLGVSFGEFPPGQSPLLRSLVLEASQHRVEPVAAQEPSHAVAEAAT
ncbi:MAG: ATP-dependent 6-phosphofructokinase [Acidobacteria bacterium]|nr:ATP-dependent 6-phosphofructokinase [Acidobacteriota bacterium]